VPVFRKAAQIQAKPVNWLWKPWIARGAVTLLDGDPELGKSTIALDLAARVSRGWDMPPAGGPVEGAEPAGVLILSAEDSPEHTIRPRLDAAGTDVNQVIILDAVRTGEEDRPPILPWDLGVIEAMVREHDIELVVDPFMAFLDGEIDAHKDQDVRRCLHRLKLLAEKTNVAILIIRHLNKLAGGPALYRGGGSIGIIGAARCSLIVGRDPDDHTCRVLACNKTNLGPKPRSLYYSLEPNGDVVRLAWSEEECGLTADDILEHPTPRKKKSAAERCADDLRAYLAGGRKKAEEVKQHLMKPGHAPNAFRQAYTVAGVQQVKEGFQGEGLWELPQAPNGGDSDATQ
jgi:RecA-family ATPase